MREVGPVHGVFPWTGSVCGRMGVKETIVSETWRFSELSPSTDQRVPRASSPSYPNFPREILSGSERCLVWMHGARTWGKRHCRRGKLCYTPSRGKRRPTGREQKDNILRLGWGYFFHLFSYNEKVLFSMRAGHFGAADSLEKCE